MPKQQQSNVKADPRELGDLSPSKVYAAASERASAQTNNTQKSSK